MASVEGVIPLLGQKLEPPSPSVFKIEEDSVKMSVIKFEIVSDGLKCNVLRTSPPLNNSRNRLRGSQSGIPSAFNRSPNRYSAANDFDPINSFRVNSSVEPKDVPSVKPSDKWLLDDSSIFGDQVKERGRFSERNVSLLILDFFMHAMILLIAPKQLC